MKKIIILLLINCHEQNIKETLSFQSQHHSMFQDLTSSTIFKFINLYFCMLLFYDIFINIILLNNTTQHNSNLLIS